MIDPIVCLRDIIYHMIEKVLKQNKKDDHLKYLIYLVQHYNLNYNVHTSDEYSVCKMIQCGYKLTADTIYGHHVYMQQNESNPSYFFYDLLYSDDIVEFAKEYLKKYRCIKCNESIKKNAYKNLCNKCFAVDLNKQMKRHNIDTTIKNKRIMTYINTAGGDILMEDDDE
jgi:hypothetical protein